MRLTFRLINALMMKTANIIGLEAVACTGGWNRLLPSCLTSITVFFMMQENRLPSQEGTNVMTLSSLNKLEVLKVWEELITLVVSKSIWPMYNPQSVELLTAQKLLQSTDSNDIWHETYKHTCYCAGIRLHTSLPCEMATVSVNHTVEGPRYRTTTHQNPNNRAIWLEWHT